MFANRSLLVGGDLCLKKNLICNCIIRVLHEVCLNGVVCPPICAFCCCPLLPKYRQFGMMIGELCWFLSVSTSIWEIKSPPASVLEVPFTTTSSFSSEARRRSCGLFSSSRCSLITSSGCTVLGVVGGGRL